MKKKTMKLFSAICVVSMGAAVFTACTSDSVPVHKHRFIDRERVEATCSTDGNIAFQECLYCGAYYLNGKEATEEAVTIPSDPALHVFTHYEANEATCLKNGNVEYYDCSVCGNKYTNQTDQVLVTDPVVIGKHILKTVEAGEATCYSKAHTQHTVCEFCHQVVKGVDATSENKSTLSAVYSGQTLEHNFEEGVCTNEGCGAKQVKAEIDSVSFGESAESVTDNAFKNPGNWQALKGEADTATVAAAEGVLTLKLASDSSVRLANVPAKDGAAFVGVYELSFNLKVAEYNKADEEKTLSIGFSLRTGAGTGNGDIVNYPATVRQTAEDGVYSINLLVEAATAEQLLQIELANAGTADTDKTVEISDINYTFYPEAAKTFVNRLDVNFPDSLIEAKAYTVSRINSDGEATTKVPLGEWRYYQASGNRNKGGKVEDNKGTSNGMTITFLGYFGTKNTERLYYRPNAPAGSRVTLTFNLSMSMDGVIAMEKPSAASYNMKANVPQTVTVTYTVTDSSYVKLNLTINSVQNKEFPNGGSCTFAVTGVTCDIDTSALVHTMETKVAAKAATCTEAGNLEYYHCTHCDKYFADELGTNDITASYLLPALGHDMAHFAAVEQSTCYQKSHAEYYHCATCKSYYSDEAGKNKLETVVFCEKLEHNYVEGVCTNEGCGAKKVENNVIETKDGAVGNVATVKDVLIENPGTWAVQYNDAATSVNVNNNVMHVDVASHATAQRAAWIRFIPANEEGKAFIGAYRISFDLVVTKSGTVTSGTAQLQVGLSIQNKSVTLAGDTASDGEEVIDFEIGKAYRFSVYLETLTAEDFFQLTVRNIKGEPVKGFEMSNVVLEYESEAAKTGGYVVERIVFAQKTETPSVEENLAVVPENKSEYAE